MSFTVVASPPPEDEGKERIPPEIITADELFAEEFAPLVWTVARLLVRGSCDMLAGKAKMGKSRLALAVAWAVSTGQPALGKLAVVQGDVLYLSLEDGQRRLQARLFQLTGADPQDPSTWPSNPRFHIASEWTRIDEDGLEYIAQWIDQVADPALVVIDTLKRVKPVASGKRQLYDTDYEALGPLTDLAHDRNVGILIVHHTRKADAEDWLDEVSGSTAQTAATDGTFILKRKRGSKDGTLYVVGRDLPDDLQLALTANNETGGWEYVGDAEETVVADTRSRILDVLLATGQPMKPAEIAGTLGMLANAVQQRLFQMMKDGQVRRMTWGAYVPTESVIRHKNVRNGEDAV